MRGITSGLFNAGTGAASGAAGGPIGAAVGAVAGFISGLFSGGDPWGNFKSEALPDMTAHARAAGVPTILWWYDDIVRCDPQGNWTIIVPKEVTRQWPEPDKIHQFTRAYDAAKLESYILVNDNWAFHDNTTTTPGGVNPVDIQILPQEIQQAAAQRSGVVSAGLNLGGMQISPVMLLAGAAALFYFMKKGKK